jgi:hypothetical protein
LSTRLTVISLTFLGVNDEFRPIEAHDEAAHANWSAIRKGGCGNKAPSECKGRHVHWYRDRDTAQFDLAITGSRCVSR